MWLELIAHKSFCPLDGSDVILNGKKWLIPLSKIYIYLHKINDETLRLYKFFERGLVCFHKSV